MESFNIFSSDNPTYQSSYDFNSTDLADIPCPDDNCGDEEDSPAEDDVELPLPPGTSRDEFPIPLPPKQEPFQISKSFSPSLSPKKALENASNHGLLTENNTNVTGFDGENQSKPDFKDEGEETGSKLAELFDDSKYSPSKVDSDDENQDFINVKPKVLGKEQAKKRLMAFSLSKQPSSSVKKQNKTFCSAKNKEKPPNPNKGSNVQEQFRATVSAIEEEKKKMFQNMPSYLLLEMSELTKSHSSMSSSSQLLEKLKNENADSKSKETSCKSGNASDNKSKSKKSYLRSRSPPNSQTGSGKRRRSRSKRRSRSRSKSKRSNSRSQRRSRSRSHGRGYKENRNSKSDTKESEPKKEFEDWKGYKDAGSVLETEFRQSKNNSGEAKSRRDEHQRRSRSQNGRPDFKPIFNYLTKDSSFMTSLQAKPADMSHPGPVLFSEKIIKYTRTKPILCWAENPRIATDFYMSRQMLLENCDQNTSSIIFSIIENKKEDTLDKEEYSEANQAKIRLWYPRDNYLIPSSSRYEGLGLEELNNIVKSETDSRTSEENETNKSDSKKEVINNEKNGEEERISLEKTISLVNDSYLSDEEQVREVVLESAKAPFDSGLDKVKIRSKWDSDCEGEGSSDKSNLRGEKLEEKIDKETPVGNMETDLNQKSVNSIGLDHPKSTELEEKKKSEAVNLVTSHFESPSLDASDATTGNLVSEYEEFLKMVSVDSNDAYNIQKENITLDTKPKAEKVKIKKSEKSCEENPKVQSPKVGTTDWDQESDHEEKSANRKIQFSGSQDELKMLTKGEKVDLKIEKSKKKPSKKKTEKVLLKKKKVQKKRSKLKKKKYKDSYSEESTSDSFESDSESDSDESKPSKKKKKKKKNVKSKKKSKKDSSSESDSDSDDDKTKKKKTKRKKGSSKKSSTSDDTDESHKVENSLLKQLDFKKQLIMKKIEEMDCVGDKSARKKEKDNRGKKKEKKSSSESDLEKQSKSGKKKKTESKSDKKKSKNTSKKVKVSGKNKKSKKIKSSSDSDSESTEESVKEKKIKKTGKRKRHSSESSDSGNKRTKIKSKSSKKTSKKIKRTKKTSSSSSDSDTSDSSSKSKKKSNKKENKFKIDEKIEAEIGINQKFLDESYAKNDERPGWEAKKLWKKVDAMSVKKKEDGDWEASSSAGEAGEDRKIRESSWDEDPPAPKTITHESESNLSKSGNQMNIALTEKDKLENNLTNTFETSEQLASETLKTSLSNFSFNENSFCSFGQELSRDFFLTEKSYSNSGNIISPDSVRPVTIEPRPFQSVNKSSDAKKPADSELYSPGYSDSELSETEPCKTIKINSGSENGAKGDVYDPLNCDSEGSADNNEIELSSIPLPRVSDILLPGEPRNFENNTNASINSEGSALKDLIQKEAELSSSQLSLSPALSTFTAGDFTPLKTSQSPLTDEKNTPTKMQLMSVKAQQKLVSKAASVFQDNSDEENIEPIEKEKTIDNSQTQVPSDFKEKTASENQKQSGEKVYFPEEKSEQKKRKDESRDKSVEKESRGRSRSRSRTRSRSRERRSCSKTYGKKSSSPSWKPEAKREKREIRSDSFEIEPLESAMDSSELSHLEQPIPVLTGLDSSTSEGLWNKSVALGNEFSHATGKTIDHAESFDIYPSKESFVNRNYDKDYIANEKVSAEKSKDGKTKKERRKSRSRSYSPKKKIRSKSPERRKSPKSRSPRRKSVSPRRRDKSPFSPRKRSPKRKSPSRSYKSSRSPDKRRKSPSRSPRKRRSSSSRCSRSLSPRKYRSPKNRDESPHRMDSPSDDHFSPRKDMAYSEPYPVEPYQNRIPVIGASNDGIDMKLSPSAMRSPYEGFSQLMPDPSAAESEIYSSFYEGDYTEEFGVSGYQEEVGVYNLITVKNHDMEKINSPERLSLDQRIELELGVPGSASQTQGDQYQMPGQVCPPFPEMNPPHFQNSYICDNPNISNDNFYQNQNVQINPEFNGQYFNGPQQQPPPPPPPSYGPFPQYPSSQPVQNSVLQVGNIVEVVPTLQHPPQVPPIHPKTPQIMQVGNVLQVVPSQRATPPVPQSTPHTYGPPDDSPMLKTQKATAVVAPSSVVPTPNPEALLNPLIRAIQLEREKRRKEKEKRKAEREARRKARQLRREAKLLSVNEKLKKSVQNEGLMLGQEVEDDELMDGLDVPSPPIPVEIITVSSPSALPPAGKGILITAGFMPKPPSEKKEVKFADGVCPGEGTSTSADEDITSPPPKPKLPKEKRFKKKKTKVKKKVKVQIIRQIIQEEDDDEDDLSPPPPPPGDPPPVFFARFPFAGDAQFPVYQTQTTTTTLTTVQYPPQSFD